MSINMREEKVFVQTVEEEVEAKVSNPTIKHKFNATIARNKTFPI